MGKRIFYTVKIADKTERGQIYGLRYQIFALELNQHKENEKKQLSDPIDEINDYIIIKIDDEIAAFVSITPPGGIYGLDKYLPRTEYPFLYENMYEGRLFSVIKKYRGSFCAIILFYAVYRWVEEHRGGKIMTIGRKDLVEMYEKTGLSDLGRTILSGEVIFHLLYADMSVIQDKVAVYEKIIKRLSGSIEWQFDFTLFKNEKYRN